MVLGDSNLLKSLTPKCECIFRANNQLRKNKFHSETLVIKRGYRCKVRLVMNISRCILSVVHHHPCAEQVMDVKVIDRGWKLLVSQQLTMWYNSGHGCPMSMRHVRATNPEASYVLWWWWWWWCVIYTCLDLNEMMKFCKRADTFAAILFHEVLFCHKMVCNECCKLDMIFFASLLSHVFCCT